MSVIKLWSSYKY